MLYVFACLARKLHCYVLHLLQVRVHTTNVGYRSGSGIRQGLYQAHSLGYCCTCCHKACSFWQGVHKFHSWAGLCFILGGGIAAVGRPVHAGVAFKLGCVTSYLGSRFFKYWRPVRLGWLGLLRPQFTLAKSCCSMTQLSSYNSTHSEYGMAWQLSA